MKLLKSAIALGLVLASSISSAQAFLLTSPDFGQEKAFADKFLFDGMGCKGDNVSPALKWENPPPGTKSFALMVHDPDAQTGGAGIWHWVIINIPGDARAIQQGAGTPDGTGLPPGSRQVNNDYLGMTGSAGWGGPCPPKGQKAHSYNFTLYALGAERIDLPPSATASQAGFMVNRAYLGKAVLTQTFARP